MTLLVVSVFGDSILELRRRIDLAVSQGADAIELRLDLTDGVSNDELRLFRESGSLRIPLILTIRSSAEGGAWDGPDDDRVSRLVELGPLADYIDVELALWRRSANIRQKIALALQRAGHISQSGGVEEIEHAARRRLLLSKHDQATRPATLHADFLEMAGTVECHALKIAWRARTVRDNFEAFDLLQSSPKPAIVICMGVDGIPSRVLARKFGAHATFASVESGQETAAGQITIGEMKRNHRWDTIDAQTRVFGLIGDPVRHSLSPHTHNAAFEDAAINAVYLAFRVAPSFESFKAFMVEALDRPWMDWGGFSVTTPHKENALRFVRDRGGSIDPLAARIGSVNTLAVSADGGLSAFNTDQSAAMACIAKLYNCPVAQLAGKSVAILGAGGVARAIIAGVVDSGAQVTVFNRDFERARTLAEQFKCKAAPWSDRVTARSSLLVNCTSVGLAPETDASPLPTESITLHSAIMDKIYNPFTTRLVREASEQGVPAIGGLDMFLRQAATQFTIWTGRTVSVAKMNEAAQDARKA